MQAILAWDDEFNIKTIAAVLRFEAARKGIDLSSSALSPEDIQRVLAAYNGDAEYGQKTVMYLPYIEAFLR